MPADDIDITVRDIFAFNNGEISATILSGRGGKINLNVENLPVLLGNSNISTTAGLAQFALQSNCQKLQH